MGGAGNGGYLRSEADDYNGGFLLCNATSYLTSRNAVVLLCALCARRPACVRTNTAGNYRIDQLHETIKGKGERGCGELVVCVVLG